MSIGQVPLYYGSGSPWVYMRGLCGHDEQSVTGTGTIDSIRLIDRLLIQAAGTEIGPGKAKNLTTGDRDSVMAALYMNTYGIRIASTLRCQGCTAPYDIDFSLKEVIEHQYREMKHNGVKTEPGGIFKLPNGCRFRLPTGEDECAIAGMCPEEAEKTLIARCVLDDIPPGDFHEIEQGMKDVSPLLDLSMLSRCPECRLEQSVQFDIQYYLLTSLKQEQKQLALEVHRLAKSYGWSLTEILDLPRDVRKTYVALVESELYSSD